jgi:uncharacterized membrane-anchored protein YhcB (DUF1043 family)
MDTFIDDLKKIVLKEFSAQATLISGIIIGMILMALYNRYFGERKMVKSYETIIKTKDDHIDSLKKVIYDKLQLIQVDKKDKTFFNKIINLFKK